MHQVVCPVCASSSSYPLWSHSRDRFLLRIGDKRRLRQVLCRDCGQAYANPQLDAEEIEALYTGYYREELTEDHLAFKVTQTDDRLDWLDEHLDGRRPKRVLEIGASEGTFLARARDRWGAEVHGIEPTKDYADHGRKRWGLDITDGFFPAASGEGPFDLIVFVHVIEHIAEPGSFLADVAKALTSDGLVFVETPNLLEPKVGRIKAALFAAPHLTIFTPSTMAKILGDHGMVVEELTADNNLRCLARRADGLVSVEASGESPASVARLYRTLRVREAAMLGSRTAKRHVVAAAQAVLPAGAYQRALDLARRD